MINSLALVYHYLLHVSFDSRNVKVISTSTTALHKSNDRYNSQNKKAGFHNYSQLRIVH